MRRIKLFKLVGVDSYNDDDNNRIIYETLEHTDFQEVTDEEYNELVEITNKWNQKHYSYNYAVPRFRYLIVEDIGKIKPLCVELNIVRGELNEFKAKEEERKRKDSEKAKRAAEVRKKNQEEKERRQLQKLAEKQGLKLVPNEN